MLRAPMLPAFPSSRGLESLSIHRWASGQWVRLSGGGVEKAVGVTGALAGSDWPALAVFHSSLEVA